MKEAKQVGDFVALVHFHKEVTVEIPVKVVAENAAELKAAAEEEKKLQTAPVAEAPVAEEAEVEEEVEAPVEE
jgi:large subunit ribosomal protein L9